MSLWMLDTNICIYLIKNKPTQVKAHFDAHAIGELCLSSITVAELMYGVDKSQHVERNRRALERFLLPFEIVSFDEAAAGRYGQIRAALEKQGRIIGNMDMQIAGHALALDAVLVTNNVREFERVGGLRIENWV